MSLNKACVSPLACKVLDNMMRTGTMCIIMMPRSREKRPLLAPGYTVL